MQGLEIKYENLVLTACLSGELDHHMASGFRDEIDEEFFSKKPKKLTLDLSGVDFMDSSGLGLIMGRYARAKAAQCEFNVKGLNKRSEKILKMSGMDKLIAYETEKNKK